MYYPLTCFQILYRLVAPRTSLGRQPIRWLSSVVSLVVIGGACTTPNACKGANLQSGNSYHTSTDSSSVVEGYGGREEERTHNVAGTYIVTHVGGNHAKSHQGLHQAASTFTYSDAFWGFKDNRITTPGAGIISTHAEVDASVGISGSPGPSLGGLSANSDSLIDFDQYFDAPVTILMIYARLLSQGDETSASAGTSFGRQLSGATGSYGSILLEGAASFGLRLTSYAHVGLVVDALPDTVTPSSASARRYASGSILWMVWDPSLPMPPLPGSEPDHPIPQRLVISELADSSGRIGNYVASLPVLDVTGLSEDAYYSLPTQINDGPSVGALVTGYEFVSDDNPFISFRVPNFMPGIESLTISYGTESVPVTPGELINFGVDGVTSFALDGFDIGAADAAENAFVYGVRFANPGLASILAVPTIYIPPGDYNENGLVDAADYVVWRKGLEAGGYTEIDYDVWRRNFGAPAVGAAATGTQMPPRLAIPEPTSLLPFALCVVWLIQRRRFFFVQLTRGRAK